MVKVIGEDPKVFKEVTCRHCAARLQYTEAEVQERHGKDYSGGADGAKFITCPRCVREVVLQSW
jgi:hypothetical protein